MNAELCTRCGGCAAVCPEQVFRLEMALAPPRSVEARFSPCPDHLLSGAPLFLPPVHALGLVELARLWGEGVRVLLVAPGKCAPHKAPPLQGVAARIKDFNALAKARGQTGFALHRVSPEVARSWMDAAEMPEDAGKRALLRHFVEEPEGEATGVALPAFLADAGDTYPFSPRIDPALCTGCDDCVNVCPHQALTVIKAASGDLFYRAVPARCTGCALCEDICEEMAVDVCEMAGKAADIALVAFQCRACGALTRTTLPSPPADGLCRICHQTGHHKKLFVVLE